MKLSAAVILAHLATPAAALTGDGASSIIVEVKCTGVDLSNLSVAAAVMAGNVLQDAYNTVHGQANSDDSELSNLRFRSSNAALTTQRAVWGGYTGGYNCRLCPKHDDAVSFLESSLSGPANKAWESEFAAGLVATEMKAFKNVKTCDIKMSPSPDFLDDPNVDIGIKCTGGPNFSDLTVAQATFVAHTLQSTYNTVHGEADDDDSDLQDVFYHATTTVSAGRKGKGYYGGYSGGYNCRLCPKHDDAVLGVEQSGASLKIWENEFVNALLESSNDAFQTVTSCDIQLTPHSKEVAELSLVSESTSDTPVDIAVKCTGLNFAKLSVADDTFAGHALEDAYNKVHEQLDDDDSELANVRFSGVDFFQSGLSQGGTLQSTRKGYYGGYTGGYNCRLCPKHDDAVDFLEVGATGAALQLWEDEFFVSLVESDRPAFKDVTQCDIKMSAKKHAEVFGESTKCGLRACADE
jgi:predicted lactoylglutathione lyase